MRITIAQIDVCRADVGAWVRNKLDPQGSRPRSGYNAAVKDGIYRFHRSGDAVAARLYLEERRLARFQNEAQRSASLAEFDAYIRWCESERPIVAGCRKRLSFSLGSGVTLGGEASRLDVDIATGGYRAVILGDKPRGWDEGLRLPLLQRGIAREAERDESDVSVGFQSLDGSGMDMVKFAPDDLDAAEEEARQLAVKIAREWHARGGPLSS